MESRMEIVLVSSNSCAVKVFFVASYQEIYLPLPHIVLLWQAFHVAPTSSDILQLDSVLNLSNHPLSWNWLHVGSLACSQAIKANPWIRTSDSPLAFNTDDHSVDGSWGDNFGLVDYDLQSCISEPFFLECPGRTCMCETAE